VLTEVEDTIVRSVRPFIYVPAYPLARWLVLHWWRLRWEPKRGTRQWARAHSLAAIGEGYAWPAIEFSSDGDFIQLRLEPEAATDVAAIRYLRDATIDLPVADFESAVEQLMEQVNGRLEQCEPTARDLAELWAELQEERSNPVLARACRWQALAGFEPGQASPAWLDEASALESVAGPSAAEEVMAVLPELPNGFESAQDALAALRRSRARVDLSWLSDLSVPRVKGELPWQTGERLARAVRESLGLAPGPIPTTKLSDLLGVRLPLKPLVSPGGRTLCGGYRNGHTDGRTSVAVPTVRLESQRFNLARLMASALQAPANQSVLPVTTAATAWQKVERAFAQELLCPWTELEAYTDRKALDDDVIADAAEHFEVSPYVVLATLVNKKRLSRARLPLY
jgi:hypothetical protein